MGQQADDEDDRELDQELDTEGADQTDHDDGEGSEEEVADDQDQDGAADEEEVEISFDGEAAPASRGDDSGLVKQLRAEIRKRDERLATLERGPAQPQKIELGPKPTLESCDFEEDRFEQELDAWKQRKAEAEAQETEAQKQTQAVQARFNEKLADFGRQKQALKVKDFDAVEEVVAGSLSQIQTAIVVKAAENSAAVIYALGRHPQKLATLAAIEDPIEFTAALVKLEGTLKVTKRTRTPPEPDTPARGSAPLSQKADKELERLEKEAERTGDRTKIVQYRKKLRAQGRS